MRSVRSLCGGVFSFGLAALLAGCAHAPEESESPSLHDEDVAESGQALSEPTCVTIRRGTAGDVADLFLSGDHPTWTTGAETSLWTGLSSGGAQNRILMRPDLASIPAGSTVVSARLRVRAAWTDQNGTVSVHRVLAPWAEASTSLATFDPATGIDPAASAGFPAGFGGTKEADVTALVSDWLSGAAPNHGVALVEPPVQAHGFWSSESSEANRPAFEVCYLPPEPEPAFDAAGCGPNGYFTDPAKFAAIAATDFEDAAFEPIYFAAASAAAPWIHEGIGYHGTNTQITIRNDWCIPGMDTNMNTTYSCGGTSHYMIFDGTHTIDPVAPTTAVAFRWGTQGPSVAIKAFLSDGSTRSFTLNTKGPNGWGAAGFFGYCTGPSALTVEKITVTGPDGGVDDVRCLGCQ